jgi:hypothetical protein
LATVLFLAWVAFDLAALDTCALAVERSHASQRTSVTTPDSHGAPAHQHAVLHPDHCFCHGLSTGADTTAALIDPFFAGRPVPDSPPGHLLRASSVLYHPPQPAA